MTKNFDEPVGFRFSKYLLKKIDHLVEENEFKNRSDVVRTATIEFLNRLEPSQVKQEGMSEVIPCTAYQQ